MPDDQRESFGRNLREAAAKRGITRQVHLRKRWNALYPTEPLSTANAAQWWNGKRIPYPRALSMLAVVVGVSQQEVNAWAGHATGAAEPSLPGTWARLLSSGLDAKSWSAQDLAAHAAIDAETVEDWLGERATPPDAETVIDVARELELDAIDALRAAGHNKVADLAAQIRTDPIGARITHELQHIEDDTWLRWLDDEHKRGIVTDDEHRRMRADYLRRKEESIRLMRADYEAALRRDQPGNTENGTSAAI